MKLPTSYILHLTTTSLLILPILTLTTQTSTPSLTTFESRFLSTLPHLLPHSTIKLIGYKTLPIPASELPTFNSHYTSHLSEWSSLASTYYDISTSTLRVYFPVEAALLEHDGILIEANHLGELEVEVVNGSHAVLGRKKTDSVTGGHGNIIKDGIIYLSEPAKPKYKVEGTNAWVYDFGVKVVLGHGDSHTPSPPSRHIPHYPVLKGRDETETNGTKVSCMSNHGGPNCSTKFGIFNGRCAFVATTCVDYNGYWTDCTKGGSRLTNFPGSDCFSALAAGHCWNEIM